MTLKQRIPLSFRQMTNLCHMNIGLRENRTTVAEIKKTVYIYTMSLVMASGMTLIVIGKNYPFAKDAILMDGLDGWKDYQYHT